MADTMSANLKATKEAKLPVRMVQSGGGAQPDRQFSDGQLPGMMALIAGMLLIIMIPRE